MTQKKAQFLTIDLGTQSVRALVFDDNGNELAKARLAIEPYFSKQPGWAEQDADYYWQQLVVVCHKLWQQNKVFPEDISAVSITTQRYTMVNLDAGFKPLRPAIVWLDQRKADRKPLPFTLRFFLKILGAYDLIQDVRCKSRDSWIAQHEPEIWQKTAYFVNISAYLIYRLSGKLCDSSASIVGYLPYDYKRKKWCEKNDLKWRFQPVTLEQMPELVAAGDNIGQLQASVLPELGFTHAPMLIASASDKACEVLGSGGIEPHIGCLSYGTTATINTCSKKYIESIPFIPAYGAAMPNFYNTEMMIYRGFWMVSWFKEQMAEQEKRKASEQEGLQAEHFFDQLLANSPAGAMGLMMQPYWSPGVKHPGPEGKGAIIGFGDVHSRSHIYRAIIEGLTYELKQGKAQIEKRSKVAITELVASGGGSQSDVIMQISANIFNQPISRPHTSETSALGAAINCAVAMQCYPNYQQAVANMVRVGKRFEPQAKEAQMYQKLYAQVYLKMYARLKPLYEKIRQITGYPH